jgi:YhcH/YjgK/YiaL family protein
MKRSILNVVLFTVLMSLWGCIGTTDDPTKWSDKKIDDWFTGGKWHSGWSVLPDVSVNKKEFAVAYFKNKERWDKAFSFLKDNDLSKLELKKYDIDGDNLYATISEYITKDRENTKFEAHRKYMDIQYVVAGSEVMDLSSSSKIKEVLVPYDAEKDIEFYSVGESSELQATPDKFFIFLPTNLHRPGLKSGENANVRKIVVKVKID